MATDSRRRFATLGLALAGLVALAGCGGSTGQPSSAGTLGTFKIGFFNTLTGPFSAQGLGAQEGFQLYLEQHGNKLGGWDIQVVTADEAGGIGPATAAMHRLVEQDQVNMVVGPTTSGDAYALRDYLDGVGMPTMVTMVSGEAITQTTHSQWIFRVEAPSSMETQVLADYTCKSLPYKKISMLSADFAGGWAASGGFARVFKQECQGKILQDLYAPLGTTDFAPILSRVDRSADALMTLELSPDAIGFVKQVRSMGLTMPILAHGATVDETLLPQEGNAAVGILAVDKYSPTLDNPGTKAFVAAYQKKFNKEPSGFPEVGYTTAQVIDAALKAVGKDATDKNKFLNAISKVNLTETARGSAFRFDSYGEGIFNIYILKVTDHNGTLQRDLVKTYTSVNQFWTWSPAQFLAMPSYDKLKGTNAG